MTDVAELKDGWGEPDPPSPTARAAARNALMREITAACAEAPAPRRRGRRLGWLVGGAVVTAAAAAVAVVLSPGQPGHQADQSAPSPDELTGQQILLRAADIAKTRPVGTGAYWRVVQDDSESDSPELPIEQRGEWVSRDGGMHYNAMTGRPGVSRYIANIGFSVGGSWLTLAQVEGLPTDPDGLKAWMTDAYAHSGDVPQEEIADLVITGLSRLLWKVPASPAVRSAALRALGTMPNVTNLGAVDGGQALRVDYGPGPADKYPDNKIPPGAGVLTLVINLDTATLVSSTSDTGTTKILFSGWTDDIPEIIPLH